ncbi:autotransporter outer membrane beta-barrel domain-containing protein [Bordetella sp. 15P40C-2]|uniref:autotransporter outer membrane beta-barrel domain-containing protein n=1 Tax=Bordetella sp. 15P40C-2 TaxID=2572246 RepID=UPI001323CCE8|nr:autotransporter outer membrane beta-barrel domain-containing protein [Bordetella sp. 15P40C-2]MVW72385.1 hypothetical protein [Bordetella sp. 15P40C-2]
MPAPKSSSIVRSWPVAPRAGHVSPKVPFRLKASVAALWLLPLAAQAQQTDKAEYIRNAGSDGRNASTFRGSTAGGNAKDITYSQAASVDRQVSAAEGAIVLRSEGGHGGNGHNGKVADTAGSVGGAGGAVSLSLQGRIANNTAFGYAAELVSSGGNAGSRRKGGAGGGAGGAITLNAKDTVVEGQATKTAGISALSRGGEGNSGYEAVGVRWSGSNGGNANRVEAQFSGRVKSSGAGITLRSEGGAGGTVAGGIVQTNKSHGGTGGNGGDVQADVTAQSGGTVSEISTTGYAASGLVVRSAGGAGGSVGGNSWLNGADGGSGGSGGRVRANLDGVRIETAGAASSGVLAESNGGSGFWGGGSALARGGMAGSGGDGRDVSVWLGNRATITTWGDEASGVQAVSRGGGGSNGGKGGIIYSPGADGSSGGNGGKVSLISEANIQTAGRDAHGLYAASLGGAAGDGGSGMGFWSVGGHGGANSRSGTVELRNFGTIHTKGEGSHGLFAQSVGGAGGQQTAEGQAMLGGDPQANSPGAHGWDVQVSNLGDVTVEGKAAKGMLVQSIGGGGGNGGSVAGLVAIGGDGKSSGDGASVNVYNSGTITTHGELGYGIHAQSIGGGGGAGASSLAVGIGATIGVGGKGGVAGNGGRINLALDKSSAIITKGDDAMGVVAQSIGGGGGDAGTATTLGLHLYLQSLGGDGAAAGNAGTVSLDTDGVIDTQGKGAVGLLAQSVGGGGGIGGNSTGVGVTIFSVSVGGSGGASGNGDSVRLTNRASISTRGDDAHGALLQSIGGGGGAGGAGAAIAMSVSPKYSGSAAIAVGGAGGNGGAGGAVQATNLEQIRTAGDGARGLIAQSIGGGGGTAGTARAFSFSASTGYDVSLAISIGRSGGDGGSGGEVKVDNQSAVRTQGEHATGLLAQSIGGGGGLGGGAASRAVAYGATSFAGVLSIGGKGGSGGDGGAVEVKQSGDIATAGNGAIGLIAQSIGGGGGAGGLTHGDTRADNGRVAIVIGRKGGDGGNAGTVSLTQAASGTIVTSGIASDGVLVQSVGGGGGAGSSLGDKDFPPWPAPPPYPMPDPEPSPEPAKPSYKGALSISLGGDGGEGGVGAGVTATNAGTVVTHGRQSVGMIVQSIGGGGGRSGTSSASAPGGDLSLALSLGGKGGKGGEAGDVTVNQHGTIQTLGRESTGLLVQSIGGGGGIASSSEAGEGAAKLSLGLALGGAGGTAGQGGKVTIAHSGTIQTANGDALVAQSIGGGGGAAGLVSAGVSADSVDAIIEWKGPPQGWSLATTIGGSGGTGGDGGEVKVTNSGTILAQGDTHAGAVVQSIGGGGGTGGAATASYTTSRLAITPVHQLSLAVGGSGGAAGRGGNVTWTQDAGGQIQATGKFGDAVRLQSVGGGGGVGGSTSVGTTIKDYDTKVKIDFATLALSGASRSSGPGGLVQATNAAGSKVVTLGEGGVGVLAQSLGGGGGMTHAVYQEGIKRAKLELGGGTGAAGEVRISQHGALQTAGNAAHGILAQSIGGGGGVTRIFGVRDSSPQTTFNAKTAGNGDANKIDIGMDKTGSITTLGDGAYGILAQSIGGGGGYVYTGWNGVTTQGPQWAMLTSQNAGVGNGAAVNVRVDGLISTSGAGAPGVFVQSIGGGGGLVDDLAGRAGHEGTGSGGPITVDVGGTIQAMGANSSAIFAQSLGSQVDSITINVKDNGFVLGGSGKAAGIELSGGKDNRITIGSGATVRALSRVAVRSTTYEQTTQIDNYGTLQGSVLLNQDLPGVVNNYGIIKTGETMALSMGDMYTIAPGLLTNHGLLQVGGNRDLATTFVRGDFRQEATGTFEPKVDFRLSKADVLTVGGTAYLDGTLKVGGRNRMPSEPVQVFDARKSLTLADGFTVEKSEVFEYPLIREGNTLLVGISADFTRNAAELSEEQVEVARYLGRKWTTAETALASPSGSAARSDGATPPGAEYAPVFDTVAEARDTQAYADVLDQIANDAIQAPVAIVPLANRMFLNRSMACPSVDNTQADAQEQACFWGDIQGNWLNRGSRHHDSGFDYRSVRYMFGGQRPLGNGWVAGGGVSYEDVNGKAIDTPLKTSGHNISGVAFLRKIHGPWSYAAAVSAGRGSYDTQRAIRTVDGIVQPHSDWNSYFAALRLQGAYTHQMGDYYVKPSMDVDVIYQRVPSYSEKGGGAFNLAFDGASDVRAMISPSVEFGGRIETAGLSLRPYMSVGVNWMPDNDWSTHARLKVDHTGDSFRLSQALPSVFGEYRIGMDIETQEGMVLRAAWRQRLGDRYNDRSVQMLLGMRF